MFGFSSKLFALLLVVFGQLDTDVNIADHRQLRINKDVAHIDKEGDAKLNTLGIGATVITNSVLDITGSLSLKEQAEEDIFTAAWGQLWVKNATPNELWYTDDTGSNFNIGAGGGTVTGTGTLDFIPVWTAGNVLGNSILFENSARIGINTIIPESLLDIRGAIGKSGKITLSTKETTIVDGGPIGEINFQTPLEADGGDAILISAFIRGTAEGTFDATNNPTGLIFGTSTSSNANEKMRLTSNGDLSIGAGTIPEARLHVQSSSLSGHGPPSGWIPQVYVESNGDTSINIVSGDADEGALWFSDSNATGGQGKISYDHNQNRIEFCAVDGTERMHIGTNIGIGSASNFATIDPIEMVEIRGPTASGFGGVLALTSSSSDVLSGHAIGAIKFQTPLEADGGDAILTVATIRAIAADDFSATVNDTSLLILLGLSGVDQQTARFDSSGKLTLEGQLTLLEQATADDDTATYGQIWVKNTSPNELWFTDDDGSDFILGGVLGADISGTGTANKLPKFSGPQTISDSILAEVSGDIGVNTVLPISGFDIRDAILTLSASDTDILNGDILGQVNFQAPDEASGGDALLPSAAIWAEANATFSAVINSTDLVFATAESETAVEKMRLDSEARLTLQSTLALVEQSIALSDTLGIGQIWVRNDDPNVLIFTDDLGTDTVLGVAGSVDWANPGTIGSSTPNTGDFTTLSTSGDLEITTGSVNIGTFTPAGPARDDLVISKDQADVGMSLLSATGGSSGFFFGDDVDNVSGSIFYNVGNGRFLFNVNGNQLAMRINSNQTVQAEHDMIVLEDLTVSGDIAVNGGDITSTATTLNLSTSSASGGAILALAANPLDNTGNSTIRLGRNTNTVGSRKIIVFKGDGSATETAVLDMATGDLQLDGDLTVDGDATFDAGGQTDVVFGHSGATLAHAFVSILAGTNRNANLLIQSGAEGWNINATSNIESNGLTIERSDNAGSVVFPTADFKILDGASVFNESGNDNDFRVEAVGAANALFVRGSDGHVGLGMNDPATKLEIEDEAGGTIFVITATNDLGTGPARIIFATDDGTTTISHDDISTPGDGQFNMWSTDNFLIADTQQTANAKLQISTPVDQAEPVLELDQNDIDDSFINFEGTSVANGTRSISSDTTEDSTKFGAIRIEINGVTKWIRIYNNES